MKFETILDAYSLACGKLDYRTQSHDEFVTNLRQCDAFRARLEKMYRHADQEAGFLAELLTVCRDPLPRG